MVAVDLSKQILDADPKPNKQINFTADLNRSDDSTYTRIHFILEEAKETILDFSQETSRSIVNML